MSHIEINAGGRHIIVDHDGELAHLADTARDLWDHPTTADDRPGPAVGFVTSQRHTPPASATAGGMDRNRPFAPANATHEETIR